MFLCMIDRKPYPSETQDRFLIRFPEGMRQKIAEEAKANNRTMNAEIVARLQRTFDVDHISDPVTGEQIQEFLLRDTDVSKSLREELEKFTTLRDRLAESVEKAEKLLAKENKATP